MNRESATVPSRVVFEDIRNGLNDAVEWVRGSKELPVTAREVSPNSHAEPLVEYAILYTQGDDGWEATVPDLPGCEAVGDSLEEAQSLIRHFIRRRLREIQQDGRTPPPVRTRAEQARFAA